MPILSLFEGRVDYPVTVTFLYNLSRCSSKQEKKIPSVLKNLLGQTTLIKVWGNVILEGRITLNKTHLAAIFSFTAANVFPLLPYFFSYLFSLGETVIWYYKAA